VAFSPDGKHLLSGGRDRSVRLWAAEGAMLLHTFQGHAGYVSSVAFDPSGNRAASAGAGGAIKLWSVRDRSEQPSIDDAHDHYVGALAFTPGPLGWSDGNRGDLVSCGGDGAARVWDASTRSVVRTLRATGKPLDCVAFTSGGRRIAAGAADGRLTWWDAATGEELRSLQCQPGEVTRFAIAAEAGDLPLMASAARDGGLRVWSFAHASHVRERSPGNSGMWQVFAAAGAGVGTAPAAQQAYATAGDWCALHGVGDWAVANFNEARRLGRPIPPLALGRSYLDAGRTDEAREQFRAALRDSAAAVGPDASFHLALFEDAPAAEAVLASAATTRPATRPAPSGVPTRLTFMSSSHPAGRRNWSETSPGRWEERWPDGTARTYDFISRGKADGASGTIVRWPSASNVQMFIPDAGEQLKYRSADTGPWKDWARVEVIDTRPDDVPWPRPGSTARTGG
jgi:WD40 repeat protein